MKSLDTPRECEEFTKTSGKIKREMLTEAMKVLVILWFCKLLQVASVASVVST
jgi:hypothetical protein